MQVMDIPDLEATEDITRQVSITFEPHRQGPCTASVTDAAARGRTNSPAYRLDYISASQVVHSNTWPLCCCRWQLLLLPEARQFKTSQSWRMRTNITCQWMTRTGKSICRCSQPACALQTRCARCKCDGQLPQQLEHTSTS